MSKQSRKIKNSSLLVIQNKSNHPKKSVAEIIDVLQYQFIGLLLFIIFSSYFFSSPNKQSLLAQTDLNAVSANAKIQTGNTQAPTLIKIDILPYGFNLDNLSGLFVINNNPNSRYLIETRPEFTQYTTFLGSDYLLDQLGLDPDKTQKRLGDAFFENQLIRDSLMRDLSLRYLDGALNDFAMMQLLMDNAVQENASLHLSIGVELTPEQCAHLTQDILWLVEKTVKGQKVLVPRLYLTSVSKDKLEASTSALAAGGSVELTAKNGITNNTKIVANNLLMSTQGSLEQNGTLIAHGDIRLLADKNIKNIGKISGANINVLAKGDVTNKGTVTASDSLQLVSTEGSVINAALDGKDGQLKAGGLLSVVAKKDIKNQQGTMEANDVSLVTKTGDIIFEAPAAGIKLLPLTEGEAGRGSLIVHHDLQMDAGHNIELQGTQIKAVGDISIAAANDLNFNAVANKQHSESIGKNKRIDDKVTHTLVNIESTGGSIQLKAGNDANLIGTNVTADKNISIHAERDTNISAVVDSVYHYDQTTKKSGGVLGVGSSKKTVTNETLIETVKGGELFAGGDVFINTQLNDEGAVGLLNSRNVNFTGALIHSKGDTYLGAKNDINLLAIEQTTSDSHTEKKRGAFGLSGSGSSRIQSETLQIGSVVSSDGDLVTLSGKNTNLLASGLTAKNDIEIHTGLIDKSGSLNVLALQDSYTDEEKKNRKKFGLGFDSGFISFSKENKNAADTTQLMNAGSLISADGNLTVNSASNINVVGSQLTAKKNVVLTAAHDISLMASEQSISDGKEHSTRRDGFSLSSDRNGVSVFAGNETKNNREQLNQNRSADSVVHGDGNVTFNSGNDIVISGSRVDANKSINLDAKNNLLITSTEDSTDSQVRNSKIRDGLTVTANHNIGQAADSIKSLGNLGNNGSAVTDVSSVMKAADSINNVGASASAHLGRTSTRNIEEFNASNAHASQLTAGEDINLTAGNTATVAGSLVKAKRDINIDAKDINIMSAENKQTNTNKTDYHQTGLTLQGGKGNVSLTAGFSLANSQLDTIAVTTQASQLDATNIKLTAKNDITIAGSDLKATKNITLDAANNLNILSSQGYTTSKLDESHKSAGAGVNFGTKGIGVTAYVALGENNLDRNNIEHNNSSITAGGTLKTHSGNDTTLKGANIKAKDIDMDVGHDLLVASEQDTGKVKGRKWDLSASITLGGGASGGANVGYGETSGSKAWVSDQTQVIGTNSVKIKVGNHTQLDGAEIANIKEDGSDGGNLSLDTKTFSYTDLKDHDKEKSTYLSLGFSSGGSPGANSQTGANKDKSNQSYTASGNYSNFNQEQMTRATLGNGNIIVRDVASNNINGLNRDISQAQNITKKDETKFDLYVSTTAIENLTDKDKRTYLIHNIEPGRMVGRVAGEFVLVADQLDNAAADTANGGRPKLAENPTDEQKNIHQQQMDSRGRITTSEAITLQGKAEDYGLAAQQRVINVNHDGHLELFGHALVGENDSDGGHSSSSGLNNSFSNNFARNQQARNQQTTTRTIASNFTAENSASGKERDGVDVINNATDNSVEINQAYASIISNSITGGKADTIFYTSDQSGAASQAEGVAVVNQNLPNGDQQYAGVNIDRTDISNVTDYVATIAEESRHLNRPDDNYANQYANQFAYLWNEQNINESRSTGGELGLSGADYANQNRNNENIKLHNSQLENTNLRDLEFRQLSGFEANKIIDLAGDTTKKYRESHDCKNDTACTEEYWQKRLTRQALRQVDATAQSSYAEDLFAENILLQNNAGADGSTLFTESDINKFRNSNVNREAASADPVTSYLYGQADAVKNLNNDFGLEYQRAQTTNPSGINPLLSDQRITDEVFRRCGTSCSEQQFSQLSREVRNEFEQAAWINSCQQSGNKNCNALDYVNEMARLSNEAAQERVKRQDEEDRSKRQEEIAACAHETGMSGCRSPGQVQLEVAHADAVDMIQTTETVVDVGAQVVNPVYGFYALYQTAEESWNFVKEHSTEIGALVGTAAVAACVANKQSCKQILADANKYISEGKGGGASTTTKLNGNASDLSPGVRAEGDFGVPLAKPLETSAGMIYPISGKTTTVLGKWTDDMNSVINVKTMAPKTAEFTENPGGFSILNVDTNLKGDDFWSVYNKPFLDAAVSRGDSICLATIPWNKSTVLDGAAPVGMFGREIQYLVEKNIRPSNVSIEHWEKIKGWYKK